MERPSSLPNQEIVLEFQESFQDDSHTSEFIRKITNRLNDIGITDIRILQTGDKSFKILYYSKLDIHDVKEFLDDDVTSGIASDIPVKLPTKKHFSYKLEIVKLQDSNLFENSFQGTIVEIKSVPDMYLKPKFSLVSTIFASNFLLDFEESETITFILPLHILEPVPYSFPEVRAGPLA